MYRGTDKSLARPTSQCILFDGENISFDASLVMYINSTNISDFTRSSIYIYDLSSLRVNVSSSMLLLKERMGKAWEPPSK